MASAICQALITNDDAGTIVPRVNTPKAAAPVAPTPCLHKRTKESAVMELVFTVAVPPTRVTVPIEFDPAVVLLATLVLIILFPEATRTKFPFVAVIFPAVAVKLVEAVKEPVTAVFPVAFPILTAPVPPVPIVVTAAPEALILAVPTWVRPARVVAPVTPRVVPTVAEVVTVKEVPAVRVVVEAIDQGAVKIAGILKVIECPAPDPVEVI